MTYKELYDKALWDLEHDNMTLGEFEEVTEPLNKEIPKEEQTDGDLISRQAVIDMMNKIFFDNDFAEFRIEYGSQGAMYYAINYVKKLPTIPQTDSVLEKQSLRDYLTDLKYDIYHELCKEIHKDEECPCTNQTTSCLANFRVCDANNAIGRIIDKRIENGRVPCGITCADSVLEDIKAEIEKLPRIKVGNSNSPTVKYCIDERLIYEVFEKHISRKE